MPHNCHRYLSTRMNDTLAHIETNHFKNSFINIFSIPFNSYSFFSFLFNLYYRPTFCLRFRRVYVSLCYCMYLCYSSAVHLLIALFYMSHWCDWHLGYTVQFLVCYRNQRMSGPSSHKVNGSEFQSERPEVAKPRDPYRASRLRGIVRSWWAAGRKCWWPAVA